MVSNLKKKFNCGVKPLVHMRWKFNWTILAPIYSIREKQIFVITSKKKVIISRIFIWKKFLPFRRKKLFKKIPPAYVFYIWILFRGEIDLKLLFRALLNANCLKKGIDSQTLEIFENFPKMDLFWEVISRNKQIKSNKVYREICRTSTS